jgi:hypothetical protein
MYFDMEMARRGTPVDGDLPVHSARVARAIGGAMGTRVVRWQASTESLRTAAAEIRRERLRFLQGRVRFEQEVLRAERANGRMP